MPYAVTNPAADPVDIRAEMIDNLTDYYPVESKNTSFYFLLSAVADIATDIDLERSKTILDTGVDEARVAALFPNFGYFYTLRKRGDLGWDWYDYLFMLKVLGEAWTLYGATTWGMRRVVQVATGVSPIVLEHYKHAGWILEDHVLGATTVAQTGNFVWNTVSNISLASATILDVWAQQQTRVWICGEEAGVGKVWFSSHAGAAAVSIDPPYPVTITSYASVHGVGPWETWACGTMFLFIAGGIISHWHHMHGWDHTYFPFNGPFRGIWMEAHNDGWAVGNAGLVVHWDGSVWDFSPVGIGASLFAVHGAASNVVYVAGANSAIARWDGVVWTDVTPPPTTDWYGVYVLDGNNAWVCGLNGWIFNTTNGGVTWGGPGQIDAQVDYRDIWVSSDQQTIRAVGERHVSGNGVLSYSVDGGTTWTTETVQGEGLGQGFNSISMRPNETMGFIVGESGTFLRRNAQSPGYTLLDGTFYANGELLYGAILESRHGRRNSADVVVWNVLDYDLLWRFLNEMKPAHVKLFLVHEVPWISGYQYYDYYDSYSGSLGQYSFDGDAIAAGIVINGRDYGDSMSRVVVGEPDLYIPQLP